MESISRLTRQEVERGRAGGFAIKVKENIPEPFSRNVNYILVN